MLYFPFLVSFLLPNAFCHSPTDHRLSHCAIRTRTLCSFYLSFVFKTFVSTLKKKEVFPQELRLKFVPSYRFTSLRLAPSLYFTLSTHFALLHCTKPPSRTTLHSSILHQVTISLLLNCTPQNHIGHTLRSPSPLIFVAS